MPLAVVAVVTAVAAVPVPMTTFSMPVSSANRVSVLAVVAEKRTSSVPLLPVSANSAAPWSAATATM